ncbi:MAG: hypothetical protein V4649_04435 [Bacteroidota bacterium]
MKGLFRHIDEFLDDHVAVALKITTAIKNILSSPAVDILTAIIPGELDNLIKQQAIAALSKVAEALAIANTCRKQETAEDKIKCFIEQLRLHDPNLQDAILQKLASLLAGQLDGKRLKQSLYDLYTQAKYSAAK